MSRKKDIDSKKIVALFGGKHQIVADFEKMYRTVLSPKTVEKWIERKSIPANQLINLKGIAEQKGFVFSIDEYIK